MNAPIWRDRYDSSRFWYLPEFVPVEPDPNADAETVPFEVTFERVGATSAGEPALRATVRIELESRMSDETTAALEEAGDPRADPVLMSDHSVSLEIPYVDEDGELATRSFAGDVVAVKVEERRGLDTDDLQEIADEFDLGTIARETLDDRTAGEFQKANWLFVHPSDRVRSALDTNDPPDGTEIVGRVLVDEEGNTRIDTHVVSVKLEPDLSQEDVEKLLREQGARILRSLGFATNLYRVAAPADVPTFEFIARLQENRAVEYAEPDLVEYVEVREQTATTRPTTRRTTPSTANSGSGNGSTPNRRGRRPAEPTSRSGSSTPASTSTTRTLRTVSPTRRGTTRPAGRARSSSSGRRTTPAATTARSVPAWRRQSATTASASAVPPWRPISCPLPVCRIRSAPRPRSRSRSATPPIRRSNPPRPTRDSTRATAPMSSPAASAPRPVRLKDAIDSAVEEDRDGKGTPVFWAASNGNVTIDGEDGTDQVVAYENTVAIGRSTLDDTEHGSAYGPELDFLAPGVDVFSTGSNDTYRTSTGTSFAAPCAAGVAGLIVDAAPEMDWQDVLWTMIDTCDQIGGVTYEDDHHDRYGFGRINAGDAVAEAAESTAAAKPSINGPDTVGPNDGPPTFTVDTAGRSHYLVELATRSELFDYEQHGSDRTPETFFPLYDQDDVDRHTATEYTPRRRFGIACWRTTPRASTTGSTSPMARPDGAVGRSRPPTRTTTGRRRSAWPADGSSGPAWAVAGRTSPKTCGR